MHARAVPIARVTASTCPTHVRARDADADIKDRYYGVNDPVAEKMLKRAESTPALKPPEDASITTLYVGGIDQRVTEDDLRDAFYSHGELKSVRCVHAKNCAFVTYVERKGAETAAEALHGTLVVNGLKLRLMWGKPAKPKGERGAAGGAGTGAGASGSGAGLDARRRRVRARADVFPAPDGGGREGGVSLRGPERDGNATRGSLRGSGGGGWRKMMRVRVARVVNVGSRKEAKNKPVT